VRALDFVTGTGLGILPKIAVTAFAGNAFVRAMNGGGAGPVVLAVIVGAIWLGAGAFAARWLRGAGSTDRTALAPLGSSQEGDDPHPPNEGREK